MVRHTFGLHSKSSKGQGHPIMFSFQEAEQFDVFPDGGGYPKRFLKRAYELLGVKRPKRVLHLCSGSMKVGITVDIRRKCKPKIIADCRKLPFRDNSFWRIMVDPPYSKQYAKNLYQTEKVYPIPGAILKECGRVLKVGGKVGFLHFVVPLFRPPLKLRKVIGITTGLGYRIRAFSVFEKVNPLTEKWRNGI